MRRNEEGGRREREREKARAGMEDGERGGGGEKKDKIRVCMIRGKVLSSGFFQK